VFQPLTEWDGEGFVAKWTAAKVPEWLSLEQGVGLEMKSASARTQPLP
jgi:hypothetical protein